MRTYKFRAWDKENKCFSPLPLYYYIKDLIFYTDYEWNQYTGIDDINDQEIYEHDIVKWRFKRCWKTEYHISEVIWDNLFCSYKLLLRGDNAKMRRDVEYEIIGNVYENPDLETIT